MDKITNLDRIRIYHADSSLGVLIFTGIGGSVDGYKGKYNTIATNLVTKHNASVFVVSVQSWLQLDSLLESTMQAVENYYKQLHYADFRLYVMGTSAGGSMAVANSYKYAQIKKVLAINPVIMANYNKLLYGIENSRADMYFVFGDQDPSAPYIPYITDATKAKVKVDVFKNVDHQFTQAFDLFLSLPEQYFFKA